MAKDDAAYRNALKLRDELRERLGRVETFLELYEEFSDEGPAGTQTIAEPMGTCGELGDSGQERLPVRRASFAQRVLHICRQTLIEAGRPMTRGELVEAVEGAGARLLAKDKGNYIGTLIWRAGDQFVNLKGQGYWPADVPNERIGYDPASQQHDERAADDETPKGPRGSPNLDFMR